MTLYMTTEVKCNSYITSIQNLVPQTIV